MNADLSTSFNALKKMILTFLSRFQIVIFVIIVVGGNAAVIFFLNGIIILSGESNGYTPDSNDTSFDQTTIKRIEELKTRDQTNDKLDLSHGRTNPFVE